MTTLGQPEPQATYRRLTALAESKEAIDEVIAAAQKMLSIFDYSLAQRGYESPARIEKLRRFLLAGRAHRLRIALHEPDSLERDQPRLIALLRQLPASIEIHRTVGQARSATDPFMVADDHSVWHLQHHDRSLATVALHSPADASPLRDRFEEIWELSESAISASTTGL